MIFPFFFFKATNPENSFYQKKLFTSWNSLEKLFNLGLAFTTSPTLFIPLSFFDDWSSFPFFIAKVDFHLLSYFLKLLSCARHSMASVA